MGEAWREDWMLEGRGERGRQAVGGVKRERWRSKVLHSFSLSPATLSSILLLLPHPLLLLLHHPLHLASLPLGLKSLDT